MVSGLVAALPMYDLPELRWATDALWEVLAAELAELGIAAPLVLDRRADHTAAWREPGLLLGQTCGYPLVTELRGHVRVVGTPVYDASGCAGPAYSSWLVVRVGDPAQTLEDLRGRQVAFNAVTSQSGYNALRALVAPLARQGRFFAGATTTGGHAASLAAVVSGAADLCAIDCVTWALLARHRPAATQGLRPIGQTAAVPALPLITAAATDDATLLQLRAALRTALAAPELADARAALLLRDVAVLDEAVYGTILEQERAALALGYPALDG